MIIGNLQKKLVAYDQTMEDCIIDEMRDAGLPVVEWLKTEDDRGRRANSSEITAGIPGDILMPIEEFHQLLFQLPDMQDLPIAYAAFKAAGEPDVFVARCFEGEYDEGTGFYVERSGFDYPRYKAYLFE